MFIYIFKKLLLNINPLELRSQRGHENLILVTHETPKLPSNRNHMMATLVFSELSFYLQMLNDECKNLMKHV